MNSMGYLSYQNEHSLFVRLPVLHYIDTCLQSLLSEHRLRIINESLETKPIIVLVGERYTNRLSMRFGIMPFSGAEPHQL
jgi:predicted class III extradiol MEMO1 family dioxygenase